MFAFVQSLPVPLSASPYARSKVCATPLTRRVSSVSSPRMSVAANTATSSTSVAESQVKSINAREILDSRGNPTIEVDLTTSLGMFRAAVPSGASTGAYEALELRDGDKSRFGGKGVEKAIANITDKIAPAIVGQSVLDQFKFDQIMLDLDGTDNKANLGANAILGVSMAACMAAAKSYGIPLYEHIANISGRVQSNGQFVMPVPVMNVINGGSHAGNKLAMQEFMILPTGAVNFKEAMKMGSEIYMTLKKVIKNKYGLDATSVGDEGGFAPNIQDNSEGLELLMAAIEQAGYGNKIDLGMDVAASEFFKKGEQYYDLDFKNPQSTSKLSAAELGKVYENFVDNYPMVTIEDPFDEDDWPAWSSITNNIGKNIQIVGDDLTVTNVKKIKKGIDEKACNGLLLKINQIGSISESIAACKMAQQAGWGVMVSHRSGETEDAFIADLVVGLQTGQIKTGAPCRSERLCKYNQLLRINEQLGDRAVYAGKSFRTPF